MPRVSEIRSIYTVFGVGPLPPPFAADSRSGVGQNGAVKPKHESLQPKQKTSMLCIMSAKPEHDTLGWILSEMDRHSVK